MKALKLNVETQTIEVIEINDWRDIAPAISNECTTFEVPISFENEDAVYCDEEGLFHTVKGGIIMEDWDYPILGNVILLGTDVKDGSSCDVVTTPEELKNKITWVSEFEAKQWADQILPSMYCDPE